MIPTLSDQSSDSSKEEGSETEGGPITMANMEARSRALDAKAAREAELDVEELQRAAKQGEENEDVDMEAGMDEDGEQFHLPNAEEREEERKAGGPDIHAVQRRMRACVRALGNFKKLAIKGR
jgi:25S rRNA (cytosine2870-C5)-methyltransferase